MKQLRLIAAGMMIFGVMCVGSAAAQKKTTKKTPSKKPAPVPTKVVSPLEVRTAREKVDIQLVNVNRFIDVMGPIVQGIETLDASAKTKKLPKDTLDSNEATKGKLLIAVRNMRSALQTLESEFRTKALLKKYLPNIDGITDLAAGSEDAVLAGKYVASKEPLRAVAKKLTDTLAAMPLS